MNDLCTPFQCNVCLMFKAYEDDQFANRPFKLFTCNGCQLAQYCGPEHQKIDWSIHNKFCNAVQRVKKDLRISHAFYMCGIPRSRQDIEKTALELKYSLRNILGRSLQHQEEELSSFPVCCAVCFKFKSLKAGCEKCRSQAYCTAQHKELHKEKHDAVCHLLQLYYCPYKIECSKEDICTQFNKRVEDFQKLDLFACIREVFSLELPANPCLNRRNYETFSWATDFSCIMTVCYAIEFVDFEKEDSSSFNIYIIGATMEAMLWFREIHCKLFFLQNPHIMELVLDFIGPEVVQPPYEEIKFSFLGSNRSVKYNSYQRLFQDYCKHYKVKPSLIVAFNCGFSEFSMFYNRSPCVKSNAGSASGIVHVNDTWSEGLVEILQTFDTPIVFTSFTEQESQFDFSALKAAAIKHKFKARIHRIFSAHKNPFRDLRPLRQWYSNDPEEFYYRNGYIQAIRTRLEK